MKLYAVHASADGKKWIEHASSHTNASKIRTRLRKAGLKDVGIEEVDINTDRSAIIRYLNQLLAHESYVPDHVAEVLAEG